MQELRTTGETYEGIATWLNEQNHQTTAGQAFTSATVFRIMQRASGDKPKKREKLLASPMRKMSSMREAGATLEEIAVWLNDHGHKTGTGNTWTASSVHRKLNPHRKAKAVA